MSRGQPPREFDHRDAGTPAAAWEALIARQDERPLVGGHDHLLVLAAHPDDETLGAGGLIHDAARAGADVTVVVATSGEASHPESTTHTSEHLAAVRETEVRAAVAVLAPSARVILLGLRDGTLAAAPDELVTATARVVDPPTVIAAPWRDDGHPDHRACAGAAAELARNHAARLLEFPIWGWHWGVPGSDGPMTGDGWVRSSLGRDGRRAKAAALAEHRSQHAPLSDLPGDEAILPPGVVEHFRGTAEVFLLTEPGDLPPEYFERLYEQTDDPWQMEGRFYEERKRTLLLDCLPRPRFRSAFEPGCGTGLLTVPLAQRCDRLLAVDTSATAVGLAARRLAGLPHVTTDCLTVPAEWPDTSFDLVVVSEVGYYVADPAGLADRIRGSLAPDGVLVACHWRHPAPGYPSTAAEVHRALGAGLTAIVQHEEEDFLLSVWGARPESVARSTGVLA